MNRIRKSASLAFVLCLLIGLLAPTAAQADPPGEAAGWPRHLLSEMNPDQMVAFGNDTMSFVNCGNTTHAKSFQYVREGATASSLPAYNGSINEAGGVSCVNHQALAAPDGTFYTTHVVNGYSGSTLTFAAFKNGRMLWETNLSSDPNSPACSVMSSWGANARNATMTKASIGSDGNIYGIVQENAPGCSTFITGINRVDGSVRFKNQLTSDASLRPATSLWVYDDKLVTVDWHGLLRQFDYSGNEDVGKQYQFPVTSSQPIGSLVATANGRVFAIGFCTGWSANAIARYHDPDGQSGAIDTSQACNSTTFVPAADNNLAAVGYYGSLSIVHVDSSTVTTQNIESPTGYWTTFVYGYWQDQDGNAIMTRQLNSGNGRAVSAVRIDAITGAVTNLFMMVVDAEHPSPWLRVNDITEDYLYMVICHDINYCSNGPSATIDGWVHKIPLSDFGTPIKDTGSFVPFVDDRYEYVGGGDSYSSGQGSSRPYLSGTETATNTCRRSPGAYPELLEADASLNLNLTRFVACGGATVSAITSGGFNGEAAQIDALTSSTDLFTIGIGGNEVPFEAFARACATPGVDQGCVLTGQAYLDAVASIEDNVKPRLDLLLQAIEDRLTSLGSDARVLVIGYPQLVPATWQVSGCLWLAAEENPAIHSVTELLNAAIQDKVEAKGGRFEFVSATNSGSPFIEHEICRATADGGSDHFNGVVLGENDADTFHPNASGQAAYAQLIKDYLALHPLS
jgi:lysophospholipase L1-like esterase